MNAQDFATYMKNRPHVVLLGAGASCAAIPHGDKNGHFISAMSGFIDNLGLGNILSDIKINTKSNNLEDIYMELDCRSVLEGECKKVKERLEEEIYNYFVSFEIPDSPTVYDFLVLSLTGKDLIATFNWNPLLVQAYIRCLSITKNVPQLAFLHGNVAVAYCDKDHVMGSPGKDCPECHRRLIPSKLLFPVKDKDYNHHMSIRTQWSTLQQYMKNAYMFTIFGYSAPKSDVEAVGLMKQAWGSVDERNLEEISIIDIRSENDVIDSWKNFIHTHHYNYSTSFFDSYLAKMPRRTCEATFNRLMNCRWLDTEGKEFFEAMSFSDIQKLIEPLLEDEVNNKGNLTDFYTTE